MDIKENTELAKNSLMKAFNLTEDLFTDTEEDGAITFSFFSEEPDFNNKIIMFLITCIEGLNRSCFLRVMFLPDIADKTKLFKEINELNKNIVIPEKYSLDFLEGVDCIVATKEIWHNGDGDTIAAEFSSMLSRVTKNCQSFISDNNGSKPPEPTKEPTDEPKREKKVLKL